MTARRVGRRTRRLLAHLGAAAIIALIGVGCSNAPGTASGTGDTTRGKAVSCTSRNTTMLEKLPAKIDARTQPGAAE